MLSTIYGDITSPLCMDSTRSLQSEECFDASWRDCRSRFDVWFVWHYDTQKSLVNYQFKNSFVISNGRCLVLHVRLLSTKNLIVSWKNKRILCAGRKPKR